MIEQPQFASVVSPTGGQGGFMPYQSYQTLPDVSSMQTEALGSQGSGLADFSSLLPFAAQGAKYLFPESIAAAKSAAVGAFKSGLSSVGIGGASAGGSIAAGAPVASKYVVGGQLAGSSGLGISGAGAASTGSAAAGTATALGSALKFLGPIGIGAGAGNLFAKFTGGNRTGGTIGGGIGAGIGMAVGGPLGAFVGGALGGAVGSLFGNNTPSNNSAGANFNPFTGQVFDSGNKGTQNIQARDALIDTTQASMQRLQTMLGFDYTAYQSRSGLQEKGVDTWVDIGSRDGSRYNVAKDWTQGQQKTNSPEAATLSIVRNLTQTVAEQQRGKVTDDVMNVIRNSKAMSVDDYLFEIERIVKPQQAQSTGFEQVADDRAFEEFLAEQRKMKS